MKQIVIKSILALGLGVASSVALAQSQPEGQSTGQSGMSNCTAGSPNCPGSQSGSGTTSGNKAEDKMNSTTGQNAQGSTSGGTEQQTQGKPSTTEQQSQGKAAQGKSDRVTGKQAQGSTSEQNKTQAEGSTTKMKTDQQAQGKAGSTGTESGTTTNQAEGSTGAKTDQQADQKNGTGTTTNQAQGQSSTGTDQNSTASISNVTVEQKTQIVNVIHEEKVEPVSKIDFEVTVGTAVPRHVHLHRLPSRIVKIVPAYDNYEYFVLADGRIVVVDPDTLEIVAILTA